MQGGSGRSSTSNKYCMQFACGLCVAIWLCPLYPVSSRVSIKSKIYERCDRNIVICESIECSKQQSEIDRFYVILPLIKIARSIHECFCCCCSIGCSAESFRGSHILRFYYYFRASNIWNSVAFPKKKKNRKSKKKNEKQKREAEIKISAASERQTQ